MSHENNASGYILQRELEKELYGIIPNKMANRAEVARLIISYINTIESDGGYKKLKEIIDLSRSLERPIFYFSAIFKTKDVERLASKEVIELAKILGSYSAYIYFDAIATTKDSKGLTSNDVIELAKLLGDIYSDPYFLAIEMTGKVELLKDKRIFRNVERIKLLTRDAAYAYFRAVADTNGTLLNDERILGNIESIKIMNSLVDAESVYGYLMTIANKNILRK